MELAATMNAAGNALYSLACAAPLDACAMKALRATNHNASDMQLRRLLSKALLSQACMAGRAPASP